MNVFAIIATAGILAVLLLVVQMDCKSCDGTGVYSEEHTQRIPCSFCHGRGTRPSKFKHKGGVKSTFSKKDSTCPRCGGSGGVVEHVQREGNCQSCMGKGKRPLYRWLLDRSGL